MNLIIMPCCSLSWPLWGGSGRCCCICTRIMLLSTGEYTGGHISPSMVWAGCCCVFCCVRCTKSRCGYSWFLEALWGIRWWDYSRHALNLNGRVCLAGAVVFGLGGTALVCLLLPVYDRLYRRIPAGWRIAICLVLLLAFIADATYCAVRPNTGRGITCSFGAAAGGCPGDWHKKRAAAVKS